MQISEILASAGGGGAAAGLAKAYGIDPREAEKAIDALVPRLTGRLERNTLSRAGLSDLVHMIGQAEGKGYLDDPKALAAPATIADGNAFLEQILGSRDSSRRVAERTSRETGLSEGLLKQLLPVIATMVVGGLAKGANSGLGEVMSRIGGTGGGQSPLPLPGEAPRRGTTGRASGSPDIDSSAPRTGGAAPRPPLPRGQSPLPIPGDDLPGTQRGGSRSAGRNPLDDLSDILRRGGRSPWPGGGRRGQPKDDGARDSGRDGQANPIELPSGEGGSLWSIVRQILGSVLGFESKGFLSWLIRVVVLRWVWRVLQRILGRMLTGR